MECLKQIDKKIYTIEILIIVASCIEVLLGTISYAGIILPGARVILTLLFSVYVMGILTNIHRYTKREIILLITLVVIVGMPLYIVSGINYAIKLIVYAFCIKRDKRFYRQLLSSIAIFILIGIIVVLGAAVIGYRPMSLYDCNRDTMRYCFGFLHGNTWAFVCYSFVMMIACVAYIGRGGETPPSKSKKVLLAVAILVYSFSLIMAGSRTGMMITLTTIGILIVCVCSKKANTIINGSFCNEAMLLRILSVSYLVIVVMCIILSLTAAVVAQQVEADLVSHTFNPRFLQSRVGNLLLDVSGTSAPTGAIGNWRFYSARTHLNCYDLGYVTIIYRLGIVPGVCLLALYIYPAIKIFRCSWLRNSPDLKREYDESIRMALVCLCMMIGYAAYNLMEAYLINNYVTTNYWMIYAVILTWMVIDNEQKR